MLVIARHNVDKTVAGCTVDGQSLAAYIKAIVHISSSRPKTGDVLEL
jgi:hypothetical protein